jgi:hypothetical protein
MMDEGWIGKYLERSARELIKVLFPHLPRDTEEDNEKPSAGTTDVSVEIQTGHLRNTNLERCRHTN